MLNEMISLRYKIFKLQLNEKLKYEYNDFKFPLVFFSGFIILIHIIFRRRLKAFNIVSSVFRSGWAGSFYVGIFFGRMFLKDKDDAKEITKESIQNIVSLPNTIKFFSQPEKMLDGVITVLKSPRENELGVIIINYSYYFLMFQKFFNLNEILKKYILILEPSWAGLCEAAILSYTQFDCTVYLMCYEKRDFAFIKTMETNIKPIAIGPSWFVNHETFKPIEVHKDIDIIMVAAWAKFKRHYAFFKAIKELKDRKPNLSIALVGYPVDQTLDEIRSMARNYEIDDCISWFENVSQLEVAKLLNRSKVNVLWSKFEGNNRAIIEGMFCNTVVVLREGHNYGERYDFVNQETGMFATERSLSTVIEEILNSYASYSPREYVFRNRSCIAATDIMNKIISEEEEKKGREWNKDIVVKVNELNRMDYFDPNSRKLFAHDYKYLSEMILKGK